MTSGRSSMVAAVLLAATVLPTRAFADATPTPALTSSTPIASPATPTVVPSMTPAIQAGEDRSAIAELLRGIDAVRVRAGGLPLAEAAELDLAAQAHSEDMVANNYLDHVGSDGSQPQDRAVRAGYRVPPHSGWIVVEVISAISADPAGPVDWWINKDPAVHGKVLMNPRWREFGGGYARGGQYGNYWTVLVGCRPGVVQTITFQDATYQQSEACDG